MKYAALALFILMGLLSQKAQAQTSAAFTTFDCSKLPVGYASDGCQSYNEMAVHQDKDLAQSFQSSNDVLVCFRPRADLFFIITFEIPPDDAFVKATKGTGFQSLQVMLFSSFKNGVIDTSGYTVGLWTKQHSYDSPTFDGTHDDKDTDRTFASSVNDAEVFYRSSYKNMSKTNTIYTVQIRRSTLRFNEDYTWDEVPNPKTPTTPVGQNSQSFSGYCAEFK
jgi:hypothetical protein